MRTDITKINEQTGHQHLTEGLMIFAGVLQSCLRLASGGLVRQFFMKTSVNSVFCVHLCALTAAYL